MEPKDFERLKTINERSIKIYFDRHVKALIFYANSIIADLEAAEEIVQDAYIKLWSSRERVL